MESDAVLALPVRDANEAVAHWRSEIIELPPEFAPGMPAGVEELRFAPGMFDPTADDYWSYAFVLDLDEPRLDTTALARLLEQYYDGLISLVAASNELELDGEPATVALTRADDAHFAATVSLVDAFVTGEEIELSMDLVLEPRADDAPGVRVLVMASPQPRSHSIWTELLAARGLLGSR